MQAQNKGFAAAYELNGSLAKMAIFLLYRKSPVELSQAFNHCKAEHAEPTLFPKDAFLSWRCLSMQFALVSRTLCAWSIPAARSSTKGQ